MNSEQRRAVEELVYRSCLALDAKDYKAFLALCDDDFRYTISTYSPEIRREMVWLDHDRKGMETLFTNLPRHNSDHSPLTRHATVYTVEEKGAGAEVVSDAALRGRALPRHGEAQRRRPLARAPGRTARHAASRIRVPHPFLE